MKTINLFLLSICLLLLPMYNPMHIAKTTAKSEISEKLSTRFRAMLCNNCGFGNKKDNCAICNKWVANNGVPASLCNDCGFGNKRENCVKCGKWIANTGVPAQLCNNCGFGNKKDNCAKCGKWVGN